MICARTVVVRDPLARANVFDALAGPGAPAGIISCALDGERIALTFDDDRTAPELIDALIAIETTLVPARARPFTDASLAAAAAALGLDDPQLDEHRLIETYLP